MSLLFWPEMRKRFSYTMTNESSVRLIVKGGTKLIQLIVSVILYFVIFFGIAFILNMLLRRTWLMSYLYPIVMLLTIDNISLKQFDDVNVDHPLLIMEDMSLLTYFTSPIKAFYTVFIKLLHITPVDIIILGSGLAGTIVSGIVIKILRRNGYQMF